MSTKIYQQFTKPVRHYMTITDTRRFNNAEVHYGIKFEMNKYYVYMKKNDSSKLGWRKIHGPFKSNYDAEQMILRVRIELAEICAAYHKSKEKDDSSTKAID